MNAVDIGKIKISFIHMSKRFFYTESFIDKNMKNFRLIIEQRIGNNSWKNPCVFDQVLYTKKRPLYLIKWARRESAETLHIDANITTHGRAIMLKTILIVLIHYINKKIIKYSKIFQIFILNFAARYGPALT